MKLLRNEILTDEIPAGIQAGRTEFAIGASSAVNGSSLGVFGWATGGKRLHGLRAKMIKMIKILTPYRK